MDRVNPDFISNLIAQIFSAAQGGTKLDINDAEAVGQYVYSIIGLGAGLISYIGSALGALCNLLGTIEKYHLEILKQKILGFQSNMDLYSRYLQDFEDAVTPEEKKDAADTLKATHIAFLSVVLAAIPEFQVDPYAVPSLAMFSLVATIHLTLLADGIERGGGWGYTDRNIETMKAQFMAKTSPSSSNTEEILLPHYILEEAISRGARLHHRAPLNGDEDFDYVTYARKICIQGRQNVKLDHGSDSQGYIDASNYRACRDYDSYMVVNVLNYAELWPFMAGDTWTETATRNVDREIFYGPYGRWADNASWTLSSPPPVTDRREPTTSIIVRAWDDIDGLQVKHGSSWDGFQGNSSGGAAKQLDMSKSEYVTSVSATYGTIHKYGNKLGKLAFTTNNNNTLENGNAEHADTVSNVTAPPGYELMSVIITRWVEDTPTGCEGVILGFRPLMTDTARS
ncbi:putative mosquitocidal toxin [Canariomyces notabilis]|uniref:Mosquitocidal toxin n=1 Tax=Canariomyces notabilis TaxID=2074819 RepID=A0AAN6TF50_9PEZI|nr:putative mosquitocidal toxin [Canariomyces arenarius]